MGEHQSYFIFRQRHRVFITLGDIMHLDELYTTIRCRTLAELLLRMGKALGATHVLPKQQQRHLQQIRKGHFLPDAVGNPLDFK